MGKKSGGQGVEQYNPLPNNHAIMINGWRLQPPNVQSLG